METSTQGMTSFPSKAPTGSRFADSTVFGLGYGYKKQSAQFTGKQTYLINGAELHQSDASQPLSVSYCLTWKEFASSLSLSSSTGSEHGETAIHAKKALSKSWFESPNPVAVVIRQSKAVKLRAGDHTAKTSELTDALAALGQTPTPSAVHAFVETYGDSWVNQVVFGAEYFLVYLYSFETRKQAKEFRLSAVASGGRASGGRASGGRASGGRASGGRASGGRVSGGRVSGPLCLKLLNNQSPGQVSLQLTASLAGWAAHRMPSVNIRSTEQNFDQLINQLQSLFASTPNAEEMLSYECQANDLLFKDHEFPANYDILPFIPRLDPFFVDQEFENENGTHLCSPPGQPSQMFSQGLIDLDEDVSLF